MSLPDAKPVASPRAIYVYCFAPAEVAEAGLDARLEVVDGLAVVWQEVDAGELTGEVGQRNLHDPDWLLPRAEAHQRTIAGVMAHGPVLPVRFATLFAGWPALRRWLDLRRDPIRRFLERMAGRQEWGVRLLDLGTPAADPEAGRGAGSGAAYLLARKRAHDLRAERQCRVDQRIAELDDLLDRLAEERTSLPIRSFDRPLRQVGGDRRTTVANRAVLITVGATAELGKQLGELRAELAADALDLDWTGPWPPYNFCPDLAESPP